MGGLPEWGRSQDKRLNAAMILVLAASHELVMSSHPDRLAEVWEAAQTLPCPPQPGATTQRCSDLKEAARLGAALHLSYLELGAPLSCGAQTRGLGGGQTG